MSGAASPAPPMGGGRSNGMPTPNVVATARRRFQLGDRVCCSKSVAQARAREPTLPSFFSLRSTLFLVGSRARATDRGALGWCVGSVNMVDEHDPDTGTTLPYVVELDGTGKLIGVPKDTPGCIAPETCWDEAFAVDVQAPLPPELPSSRPAVRFSVGDKVTCRVGDSSGNGSEWVSGVVTECWAQRDCWGADEACAYAIEVGSQGGAPPRIVLAHRDEHHLVRDPLLQPPGPPAKGVSSSASRFGKRKRASDGQWETIDHQTRRVRPAAAPAQAEPARPAASTSQTPVQTKQEAGGDKLQDDAPPAAGLMCGECE